MRYPGQSANQRRMAELAQEIAIDKVKIIEARGYRRACDNLQKDITRTLQELPDTDSTRAVRATLDAVLLRIIQTRSKADE